MNEHSTGIEHWRSLEQLADSPDVRAMVEAEFPGYDPEAIRSMSRRRFMKLMAASMALAGVGLTGCRRWPKEKLAPYTSNPKDRIPGVSEQYATVMEVGGVGVGLLVSSFDGRPIKVEGNPSHPFSRTLNDRIGAADAIAQASVLELYDPDRSRGVVERSGSGFRVPGSGRRSSWEVFEQFAENHFGDLKASGGDGLAILCEGTSSVSVGEMRKRMMGVFPKCAWYEHEAISRKNEIAGAKLAFGKAARMRLHLDRADTVVLFDADLLGTHPARVRYASDWATRRRSADQGQMNRVYIAESAFSVTGSVADVRVGARLERIDAMVGAVAEKVLSGSGSRVPGSGEMTTEEQRFVERVAEELRGQAGKAVVVAGPHLSPEAHAAVHAINQKIGATGTTVTLLEETVGDVRGIKELAEQMKAGKVKTLLILGGNPAYDAPADLEFAKALAGVPVSIRLGLYEDETSLLCRWHLPRAHYLETWSDSRAWDGTVSIAQPLIEPLYGGKSIVEVLAIVMGEAVRDGYSIVKRAVGGDEKAWRKALHDGVVEGSGFVNQDALTPALSRREREQGGSAELERSSSPSPAGFEVRFLQDASVYDGRFANSGWLQEMPDPLTKLTWDNAALLAKQDADQLGVKTGDVVKISVGGRAIEIAAYVMPGWPVGVIGLPLGYGRRASGNVGTGVGVDVNPLRTSDAMWVAAGAKVEKTGRQYKLAMTQDHHIMDEVGTRGREKRVGEKNQSGSIIREAALAEYHADHQLFHRNEHGNLTLQLFESPSKFNEPHAWGMAVDMNSCIGCNACVVACQAENNIPVVGKDQVAMNREMHWIRIDRYFKGRVDDPDVVFQPVMCQHCENAPCEQVCPVAATVHDTEGLNTMVYNRCIGTRYCSNNCPYKVRRFNYFDFHSKDPRGAARPWLGMPDSQQNQSIDRIRQLVFNPDVTVRMRGVMEKCTYCVQRIKAVEIEKRRNGEDVRDGDVVTACQQACPTQAIVFGDLNDPESQVSRLHRSNRAYAVLEELNVRPRTQYLAKIRNREVGPRRDTKEHE